MNSSTFFNTLGSYRLGNIFVFLIKSGFSEVLTELKEQASKNRICERLNWNKAFGTRILDTLKSLSLIHLENDIYSPSETLSFYFSKKSRYYQGYNIIFEQTLNLSWVTLKQSVEQGKRIFNSKTKSTPEYKKDLELYIRAMDNVAMLRSNELLSAIDVPDKGYLLDLASGSGAYVTEFLNQYHNWNATCFDLPDVINLSMSILKEKLDLGFYSKDIQDKINYQTGDILQKDLLVNRKFDCILLSNIIHCYDKKVVSELFRKCYSILNNTGLLLIHDFFKGTKIGDIYDLHMMINTFSGRTYKLPEVEEMLLEHGIKHIQTHQLPSGSVCMVFTKIQV